MTTNSFKHQRKLLLLSSLHLAACLIKTLNNSECMGESVNQPIRKSSQVISHPKDWLGQPECEKLSFVKQNRKRGNLINLKSNGISCDLTTPVGGHFLSRVVTSGTKGEGRPDLCFTSQQWEEQVRGGPVLLQIVRSWQNSWTLPTGGSWDWGSTKKKEKNWVSVWTRPKRGFGVYEKINERRFWLSFNLGEPRNGIKTENTLTGPGYETS